MSFYPYWSTDLMEGSGLPHQAQWTAILQTADLSSFAVNMRNGINSALFYDLVSNGHDDVRKILNIMWKSVAPTAAWTAAGLPTITMEMFNETILASWDFEMAPDNSRVPQLTNGGRGIVYIKNPYVD